MTTNTEPLSTPANDIFLLLVFFRLSRLLHRFGSCNGREWELGMNTAMSRAHEAKKNAIVIIVSSCKSALSFKISSHKWQLLSYQTCIKMALALAHIRYAKSEVKTKNHFNRATWGFLLYMIHVRALCATMNNSHIIFFPVLFLLFHMYEQNPTRNSRKKSWKSEKSALVGRQDWKRCVCTHN